MAAKASRYHALASKYFNEIRIFVDDIIVITVHANCIRIRNNKGCKLFCRQDFLLWINKMIAAKAVNSIKDSSGKSVASVALKLYSTDQGTEAIKR